MTKIKAGHTVTLNGREAVVTGRVKRSSSGANGWLILTDSQGERCTVSPRDPGLSLVCSGRSEVTLHYARQAGRERATQTRQRGPWDKASDAIAKGDTLEAKVSGPQIGDIVTIGKGAKAYSVSHIADGKARLIPAPGHPSAAGSNKYGVPLEDLRVAS